MRTLSPRLHRPRRPTAPPTPPRAILDPTLTALHPTIPARRPGQPRRGAFLALLALTLGPAAACADVPLARFDPNTYVALTRLKAETTLLVATFDTREPAAAEPRIEAATLHFHQAYEYEVGKGTSNADTAEQFALLLRLFQTTVEEYQGNGPGALGSNYFREAARVLGQAFDAAIATENAKNPAHAGSGP